MFCELILVHKPHFDQKGSEENIWKDALTAKASDTKCIWERVGCFSCFKLHQKMHKHFQIKGHKKSCSKKDTVSHVMVFRGRTFGM